MTGSSLAGIVGAAAGVITSISLLLGAIPALIKVKRQTTSIHHIVNQQRTDMQNWNRALVRALKDAGIEVPIDQSAEEPPSV